MNLKTFATIISRIFDFYFWGPVLLFVGVFNSRLTVEQIKLLLPLLFLIDVISPILIFFFLIKVGKISDIDITKRQERYFFFGSAALILAFSTILVFLLGNQMFFVFHLIVFVMTLTNFLITLRFKISGHLILNTGSIFALNFLFGFQFLWLFAIVLLVAFARIYLKKHSLGQVIAGAIVGLGEPYLILKIFKLI